MTTSPIKLLKHLPRRGKIVLITALVLPVAIALAIIAILFLSLEGGVGQWLLDSQSKPNFNSAFFVSLRQKTSKELSDSFLLVPTQQFQRYAESESDHCDEGQHNFEVHDPYAYACEMLQTQYYGFDGDFKQQLESLDVAIQNRGWSAGTFNINRVLAEYYSAFYKGPGSSYTVGNLPGADYSNGDFFMHLEWVERGDTDLILFSNQQNRYYGSRDTYQADHTIDAETVATNVFQQHRYAMSVRLTKVYYSK